MLYIPCPWCGMRNEDEFLNGGEADKSRPDPASASQEDWYQYIYIPSNTKGWLRERWWHAKGCQRWFKIDRNTHTHEIKTVPREDQWL